MKEVLMVAEKPNLAQTLSNILSRGNVRKMHIDKRMTKGLPLYEWDGAWPHSNEMVRFKMTSTYGHINELKFEPEFDNNWTKDPEGLFSCGVVKAERDLEAGVGQQLQTAGRGVDYLVLWLDCDREGENICFEVMDLVVPVMKSHPSQDRVFRALFSALTEHDVTDAFMNLRTPNRNEALSVDARMELDLRIGCAFTRFQTRYFMKKYGKETLKTNTVPFGPCQTPTLGFCVERHRNIVHFQGQPFWKVQANVEIPGSGTVPLAWKRGRTFNQSEADEAVRKLQTRRSIQVTDVTTEEKRKFRPAALNTVQLLRMASSYLRISPNETMEIAERLYMDGFISYPRTETTQYPASFDRISTIGAISGNDELRSVTQQLMYEMPDSRRVGTDAGDHPPIIPLKNATPKLTQNQRAYDVYQMICKYFLATLASDCVYLEKTCVFDMDGDRFTIDGIEVVKNGYTDILKHQRMRDKQIPHIGVGSSVDLKECRVEAETTTPPEHLTESDLIDSMEKHGIGTDASIPVHIQNIFKRNFVALNTARRIIPTPMGLAMIQAYDAMDPDLAKPQIRSTLEKDLGLIAEGKAQKETVVSHILDIYRAKYKFLVTNIARMDMEISGVLHLIQQTPENSVELLNNHSDGADQRGGNSRGGRGRGRGGSMDSSPEKRSRGSGGGPPKRGKRDDTSIWSGSMGNANEIPVARVVRPAAPVASGGSLTDRLKALAGGASSAGPAPVFPAPVEDGFRPSFRADIAQRHPQNGTPRGPPRGRQPAGDFMLPPRFPRPFHPGMDENNLDRSNPSARKGSFFSRELNRGTGNSQRPPDARFQPPENMHRPPRFDHPPQPRGPPPGPPSAPFAPYISPYGGPPAHAPALPVNQWGAAGTMGNVPSHPAATNHYPAYPNTSSFSASQPQYSAPAQAHPIHPVQSSYISHQAQRAPSPYNASQPPYMQPGIAPPHGFHQAPIFNGQMPQPPVFPPYPQAPGQPPYPPFFPQAPTTMPPVPPFPTFHSQPATVAIESIPLPKSESPVERPTSASRNKPPTPVKTEPVNWTAGWSAVAPTIGTNNVRAVASRSPVKYGYRPEPPRRKLTSDDFMRQGAPVTYGPVSAPLLANAGAVRSGTPVQSTTNANILEPPPNPMKPTVTSVPVTAVKAKDKNQRGSAGGIESFSTSGKNAVQSVYEYCSKSKYPPPIFNCASVIGPSSRPEFSCALQVSGSIYGPVSAPNKKDAMKAAAQMALNAWGFPC